MEMKSWPEYQVATAAMAHLASNEIQYTKTDEAAPFPPAFKQDGKNILDTNAAFSHR